MKIINWDFLVGVAYITFLTTYAVCSVGESIGPVVVIGWDLPAKVFSLVTTPFVLGYLAGRVDGWQAMRSMLQKFEQSTLYGKFMHRRWSDDA